MSIAAVLIAALVLIGLGTLIVYVGSVARSAYALKVDLERELQNGLFRIKEELEGATRRSRAELGAEIDRSRNGIQGDMQTRFDQFSGAINRRLAAQDEQLSADRAQFTKAIAAIRTKMTAYEDAQGKPKVRGADTRSEAPPDLAAQPDEMSGT